MRWVIGRRNSLFMLFIVLLLLVCAARASWESEKIRFVIRWTCGGSFASSAVPFDGDSWKNGHVPFWSQPIRARMARDIVSTRRLIGLSKIQVVSILGQPTSEGYPFDDYPSMNYWLDITYSDSSWLTLCLDEKAVVTTAAIRED